MTARVEINKACSYKILATDRLHPTHGTLISRTEVDGEDSAVSIYDSGTVVIRWQGRTLTIDLETGKIDYA